VLLKEKTWHGLLTRDTQVGGKIIEVVHGNPPKKHFSLDEGSSKKERISTITMHLPGALGTPCCSN
jgi:hypothetical protein